VSEQATELLLAYAGGQERAADRLMPLVYDNLKRLAAGYLEGERSGHTLQATALVHEAYLRLVDISRMDWRGKTHFFAMAATQMRRILVEHARRGGAEKRWDRTQRVTFDEDLVDPGGAGLELLALDESLKKLEAIHPRRARVAELRLFAGLTFKESALAVNASERTVKDDWRVARAWLARDLGPSGTTG